MLPAEYEPDVVPPSLIYGAQHLLRLFVKERGSIRKSFDDFKGPLVNFLFQNLV